MKTNLQAGVVNAVVQFQLFDGPREREGNAIYLPLAALENIIRRLPLWSATEHLHGLFCEKGIPRSGFCVPDSQNGFVA